MQRPWQGKNRPYCNTSCMSSTLTATKTLTKIRYQHSIKIPKGKSILDYGLTWDSTYMIRRLNQSDVMLYGAKSPPCYYPTCLEETCLVPTGMQTSWKTAKETSGARHGRQ